MGIIKYLSLMLVTLLPFCSAPHSPPVTGIVLSWKMSLFDPQTDKLTPAEGSNRLYFDGDLTLYQKEDMWLDAEENVHPEYNIMLFKKGHVNGYQYNPKLSTPIKFNVDTFMRSNAFRNAGFYGKNDSLIYTERNKKDEVVLEKYVSKMKPDYSYPDTTIFYFDSELNEIPFSLDPVLEKLRKNKIATVKIIYNPLSTSQYSSLNQRRVWTISISKLKTEPRTHTASYFSKFRTDSKSLQ